MNAQQPIGQVKEYLNQLNMAVVELTADVALGDIVVFRNDKGEFDQTVEVIQIDEETLEKAGIGDVVAIEVHQPVTVDSIVLLK